ncbi:FKBP-type peptidyl-prolyl cis-trans isomerase [Hymenobacter psychrophilus]|uniref:Peptidyl-prolyl cis-trans isomerase n=2 Tax=Hymenobacter psychrophilus TaxID=651662 RepID=A0A1H3KBZ0_9BACT|nr:FKBP-type peptidyl-prolyl cis-trans isomerase [Hymenobacter psychrophilus]
MNFRLSLLPVFLMALLFALGACKKSEDKPASDYTERDKGLIDDYIKANNLTGFTNDSVGVYVSITSPGTGPLPTKGQTIIAKYVGKTLDGQVFDQTKATTIGFAFVLGANPNQVIKGWEDAFTQLNKGSKAILLITSAKAYGSSTSGTIPPNSVLRFDVEVVNIK